MAYNTVTVTTSATKIISSNHQRHSYIITNTDGTNKLYLGPDSSVTTSNGVEIATSGSIAEDSGGVALWKGDIWGIAAASIDVRYWERTQGV